MKKLSKLVALALACVMALTMLTACGGGGGTSNDKNSILKALNAARKESSLSEVKLDDNLNAAAAIIYKNNKTNHQAVTVNGQKYAVHMVKCYKIDAVNATLDWKTDFKKSIAKWADRKSTTTGTTSSSFVGREDLEYVGIWTGTEDGKMVGCIVIGLPEGVSPWN